MVAALPGLDAADGEDEEPSLGADLGPPAGDDLGRRRHGEALAVDAVGDDGRGHAVLGGQPLLPHPAHDEQLVGIEDRPELALDERRVS